MMRVSSDEWRVAGEREAVVDELLSIDRSPSAVSSGHSPPVTRHSPLTGLHLIYGHPAAREVGFYMAAEWLCRRQIDNPQSAIRNPQFSRVIVVDGENSFDPFVFGNAARRAGLLSDSILHNLFISRAFTCHQLQALIVDRLIPAIRETHSRLILVLGLLTTFYDEQVPMWEAQRLLRPTLGRLLGLAKRGYGVMILLPGEPRRLPQRQLFLQWTKVCAERVLRVEVPFREEPGIQRYVDRKPEQSSYVVNVHLEKPAGIMEDWQIQFDPAMQPGKRWQA